MKLPETSQLPETKFAGNNELSIRREQILYNILRGMSILGLLLLGSYVPRGFSEGKFSVLAAFALLYVWIVLATFLRKLPYMVRALSLLIITYLLGAITFMQDGLSGNARIYLMSFTVLSMLLIGTRGGIIAGTLSVGTILGTYFVIQAGYLPSLEPSTSAEGLIYWVIAAVAFLVIAAAIGISATVLLNSLENTLANEKALSAELKQQHDQLESNIQKRTDDLERRLTQIRTAADISRSISAVLDPGGLLQQVVDTVQERFNLYYVGVFLLSPDGKTAVLRSGSGEAGREMVANGHNLSTGSASMVGSAIANRKARIALDIGAEAVRFNNPYLPLTRSEAALPLINGDNVLGAMTIQSSSPEAFDENDLLVLQGIADSLATALANAQLFEQSQKSLQEIRNLHRQYLSRSWSEFAKVTGGVRYAFESEAPAREEHKNRLELPISIRDQVIGSLTIEGERSSLSPEEMALIQNITTEAAMALENARLLETTQQRAAQEATASEIARKVRSSTDIDTILRTSIEELCISLNATEGEIRLETDVESAFEEPSGTPQENYVEVSSKLQDDGQPVSDENPSDESID